MGSAIFTTQYLQSVLGMSALEAALWGLVPAVPIGFAAPLAAALVQKGVDRAYVVTTGFALAAGGYLLLTQTGRHALWLLIVACAVLASGIVMVMSQMTDLALGAAPAEQAGAASSLLETGAEFGGALGMAGLGAVGTAVYRHDLPVGTSGPARETLAGALGAAQHLPGRAGDALVDAARAAFTSGLHAAAIAGALVLLGAAVAAAATLRGIRVRPAE